MAVTAITPIQLVLNAASADHADADGTAVTNATDGFSITLPATCDPSAVVLIFVDSGATDTVVITAGDNPPSIRAGLGNLTFSLAASDVKRICLEPARFLQDDFTYKGTCATTTKVSAVLLPVGITGGTGLA